MKRKNPYKPKKKKKKDLRKEELREYRKALRQGRPKPIRLVCSICGKSRLLRTTQPELYTDELKKKNVCAFCMYDKQGNKIFRSDGTPIKKEKDK